MMRTLTSKFKIHIALGRLPITLGVSWLLVIPVGLWAIDTIYVPILGAPFNRAQGLAATALIALLVSLSLLVHLLVHALAQGWNRGELPESLSLYPFGDTAQAWPVSRSPWREALAAFSGPTANLVLAGVAYLVWNAQLNPYLNLSMPFFGIFNFWLAAINLIPAFPFDGGRLLLAILWGLLGRPTVAAPLGMRLGLLISAAVAAWGFFLLSQGVRFSLQTGAVTLVFVALILFGLWAQPAWEGNQPASAGNPSPLRRFLLAPLAGVLILALLAAPAALALTNDGIEAPGVAISVEPMVEVPQQYRHTSSGTFILTTVIPQAPILGGEWVLAKLNPVIRLMPPQQIVPESTTPQEMARQGNQMLNQSETDAIVEGLRLAGYPVQILGKGVEVTSILPDSKAKGILEVGDVITGIDGVPVRTTSDLTGQLAKMDAPTAVNLQIQRDGVDENLSVPLEGPAASGQPPKIGITVVSAGSDVQLPFQVKIVTQKIAGGPSAGLMFTLTVYNALTPGDLTGGRKIAGTGTINLDGTVGPIGGVQQKVAAAEGAGAEYFLSPPENYAAASAVARNIKVIKVATAEQAIEFLRSLPPVTK